MSSKATKEPQYNVCLDHRSQRGPAEMGLMSGYCWDIDPKRLVFVLSRYKFVSKMLSGLARVAEVGCADAFGTRIVMGECGHVTAVDFDPVFIEDARCRSRPDDNAEYLVHDMLGGPVPGGPFDGLYSLDVIEHIDQAQEDRFLGNIASSLKPHGVLVLGTPTLESQAHASAASKAGHINCKSHADLKALLRRHFANVFLFSMNDEVVHTGFYPMAHYLFALCCAPIR